MVEWHRRAVARLRARLSSSVRVLRERYGAPHARRVLVAWWSVPVLQFLMRLGDVVGPTAAQWLIESSAWVVAGAIHAACAPRDWRGSPAWPAAAWLLLAAARLEGVEPGVWMLALIIAAAYGAIRALHEPLWRRIPALLLTATVALVTRWASVGPPDVESMIARFASPRPRDAPGGPPIVVVTVDTLRADAAGSMQSLAWMEERGSVFPRAMAASSWTAPSLATLWTGTPKRVHGAGRDVAHGYRGMRTDVSTLAEELSARGYRTAAFVTNPVVGSFDSGLRRGFETWEFIDRSTTQPLPLAGWPPRSRGRGDAQDVVDAALAWLEDAPTRSWLLWVHLFEPHLPYEHAPEHNRFTPHLVRSYRTGRTWHVSPHSFREAYEREVRHADRHVMRLLRALDARGHFDQGAVVFASDHGEEILEHGGLGHGHSHHGEVIDVPLALVAPGAPRGKRSGLASLEDVTPTLRAVAGIEPQGRDLRQPIETNRVATAEGTLYYGPQRSLRTGSLRFIESKRTDMLVFDLETDPHERDSREPSPEELSRFRKHLSPGSGAGSPSPGPDVNVEALRSLGYVE